MDNDSIRQALLDAADLASAVPDGYRVAAFRVAAEALLSDASRESPVAARAASRASSTAQASSRSVNEELAQIRDRAHTDKFEAIMHHALDAEGIESVTVDDILAAYSSARIARPTNPSDIIAKCSRRGHVVEGPRREGQKTWRLTGTGQRYVQALLQEVA